MKKPSTPVRVLPLPAVRVLWDSLPPKSRGSAVGRLYGAVIEALDADGYAPLPAILASEFPDDAPDDARRALGTQFINRPPLDAQGRPLLRLKTDRIPGKGGESVRAQALQTARVWFESESQVDAAAQTPVRPRYPAQTFTPSDAVKATGQELARLSEVLEQSLLERELTPPMKPGINLGSSSMRHGTGANEHFVKTHAHILRPATAARDRSGLRAEHERFDVEGNFEYLEAARSGDAKHRQAPQVVQEKALAQGPALEAMLRWAVEDAPDAPRLLALLGDYGTGKTSHGLQFARILNGDVSDPLWTQLSTGATPPQKDMRTLPRALFIDLAELAGVTRLAESTLEDMLLIVLRKRAAGVETLAHVQAFIAQAQSGQLIFVFDGLDELLKNETQVLHNVFGQMLRVLDTPALNRRAPAPTPARNARAARTPARFIVSCRTHYFRSIEQQNAFFDTRKRGAAAGDDYLTLTLLPWGNEHIETYLGKRLGKEDAERLLHIIRTTYNLEELASRPVLLAMMSEQIEALLRKSKEGAPITAAQMYNITVAEWIARDDGKHHLAPEHKPLLMGALAAAMWDDGTGAWGADRLDPWLLRTARALFEDRYPPQFAAAMQNDLRTATFIVRPDAQRFNFAHRSFMEYFLARFWVDALGHAAMGYMSLDALRALLPRRALNAEAMQFLRELWAAEDKRLTEREQAERVGCLWRMLQVDHDLVAAMPADMLHKTIFTLIVKLGLASATEWNLSRFSQSARSRSDAPINLRGLHFVESVWEDIDLAAKPSLDLRGANLRGLQARRCRFGRVLCDAATNWSQSVLRDCNTNGVEWGSSVRGGMLVRRTAPLGRGDPPETRLAGPWQMPFASRPVTCVAFSPDGLRIAVGSYDHTVRIYQAQSGRELLSLRGHCGLITSVDFSFEGARIGTGSYDNTARIWDALSGDELIVLNAHSDFVTCVAFSPDGASIATGSNDNTARTWNALTGSELLTIKGHANSVSSVAFSPDSKRIATGSQDNTARIWDAQSGRQLGLLHGHRKMVVSLAFSPDGTHLVTGSQDDTARVWDVPSGRRIATFSGHAGAVMSVAFAPDGKYIASGSHDKSVRLWDASSAHEVSAFKHEKRGPVNSLAYSPNGDRIAIGSYDGGVYVWDTCGKREIVAIRSHGASLQSLACRPDGKRVAVASWDGRVCILDSLTGHYFVTLNGHYASVHSVAYSPDGSRLATASSDGSVRVWDANTGHELAIHLGNGTYSPSAVFGPDGTRLAIGSTDAAGKVVESLTGREIFSLTGHGRSVSPVAFSSDGKLLVFGYANGDLGICETANGEEQVVLAGHEASILSATFSPDATRVATASADGTALIWDVLHGQQLIQIKGHTDRVTSVAFSPDGTRIVTGSRDCSARVWDAASGRLLHTLTGHGNSVNSVAFSPDGARIVTASTDGTVRTWWPTGTTHEPNATPSSTSSADAGQRCRVMVPHPTPPFEPSWADFDAQGNLLAWSDTAPDHWLFRVRDGVSEPIEAAL